MTEVPDNVLFRHMTPEQKAIVLMWYAIKLETEWKYKGNNEWYPEDKQYSEVFECLKTEQDKRRLGYLDCFYRLKSP